MKENEIKPIITEIENELSGKTVRYEYKDNLHQFIVEGDGLSFTIFIHQKFFEEAEPIEILNEFYKYHVLDTLKKSMEPVWLYLSISGLKEVDENFAKNKPD